MTNLERKNFKSISARVREARDQERQKVLREVADIVLSDKCLLNNKPCPDEYCGECAVHMIDVLKEYLNDNMKGFYKG